jgi:hypothetical protein
MCKEGKMNHPFKDLEARRNGFGIAAGIEKPYKIGSQNNQEVDEEAYASIPHSGYYGVGLGDRPFKRGQAGFESEINWYKNQFGEVTSEK